MQSVLVALVAAFVAARLVIRAGLPALVGEIVAGIVLGPSVLALVSPSVLLHAFADAGAMCLVFLAGLEIDLSEFGDSLRGRNAWIPAVGFVLPFCLGTATGVAFHFGTTETILIAACAAITALPVAVRILTDIGRLQTPIGRRIVSTAVVNDMLAIAVLGMMLIGRSTGMSAHDASTLELALLKVGLFFVAMLLPGSLLEHGAAVRARRVTSSVTSLLLGPLFFFSIGLAMDVHQLASPVLVLTMLTMAVVGKIVAGRIGGALAGMTPLESWTLGFGLNGRGMMELVVASIAFSNGLISSRVFAILVLMGVATTCVTPPLLRAAFARLDRESAHGLSQR